jgi:pimeloyl-ACP methyl ester carboxylesterase
MNWREFQAKQRVMEIGDRFVSYIDEGSGDPIVLLHGIPTWGYLWQDLIPSLSGNHRVLVPDLLGFGYSDRSDRFDRSIARQAEMIDAWLEKLGVERASLVAHDIGGGVALRLAVFFPKSSYSPLRHEHGLL